MTPPRRRWTWLAAGFVGFVGFVGAACNGLLGINPLDGGAGVALDGGADTALDGGTDAGLSACGVSAGTSACAQCIQTSCCVQAQACAMSGSCNLYEDCALGCGSDYACKSRCVIADYANVPQIPVLDTCIAASCDSACGLQCGMTTSIAEPDAAAGCVQCLVKNASADVQACTTSLACEQLQQQVLTCPTEDCFEALAEGNDAGAVLLAQYLHDSIDTCAGACSYGSYWDCLPSLPGVIPPSRTITFVFSVVPANTPPIGATVKACSSDDQPCVHPFATKQTDEQGAVTFVLSAIPDLYLDISLPGTLYPTLYFFQDPITAAEVTLPALLVPPLELVPGFYSTYGGLTPDPSKGTIEIESVDCHWYPAGNTTATANIGDGGVPFAYFSDDVLTPSATSTASSGFAVLLYAPVWTPVPFSTTPEAVGRVAGTGTMFARPGTLSFMAVGPK